MARSLNPDGPFPFHDLLTLKFSPASNFMRSNIRV